MDKEALLPQSDQDLRGNSESELERPTRLTIFSVVSLVVAITVFLVDLWAIRWFPSMSTDSLVYHLTIPVRWLQLGFPAKFDLPFHDGTAIHSPLLTESLIYLLMKWTGSDAFAWLVQPAFFLLILYVFYHTVIALRLSRASARILTALLCLFSPFFRSAQIVNSEMVMTSGVAIFCLGMLQSRSRFTLGSGTAALGIALTFAAKSVGTLYAAPAVLILAWSILLRHQSDAVALNQRLRTACYCGLIISLGLAFHLRNLVQFGNPLYPADISLLGIRVLPGLYDMSVFVDHHWSLAAISDLFFQGRETFALRFYVALPLWLAMLGNLLLHVRRKKIEADVLPLLLFVVYPMVCVLLYLAFTPFWREHRLLFPPYYLLWCGAGMWLASWAQVEESQYPSRFERTRFSTMALATVYFIYAAVFLFFDEPSDVSVLLAVVVGVVLGRSANWTRWFGRAIPALPCVVLFVAILSSHWWYAGYLAEREGARRHFYGVVYGPSGEAWNAIEDLTAQQPATIAYSGTALIYPLYGNSLANRVVYLPIHPDDQPHSIELNEAELIYLQLARDRRRQVDEAFWLAQLKEEGIDYLFLVEDPELAGVQAELTIAAQHPQLLVPIFRSEGVHIFKVEP